MEETTQRPLRRLPWSVDGKDAFVEAGTGGPVNRIADQMEELAVKAAHDLADEVRRMARDMTVTEDVLRRALINLAAITKDVVQVAELRGERLGVED